MSTESISNQEAARLARAAADAFQLPEDWREGREHHEAFAFGTLALPSGNVAVAFTGDEDGGTLRLSVPDTSTFLVGNESLEQHARRSAWALYHDGKLIESIFPPRISEDLLAFLPNEERPAITIELPMIPGLISTPSIVQSVVKVHRYGLAETQNIIDGGAHEHRVALRALERAAHQLFMSRKAPALDTDEIWPKDDRGRPIEADAKNVVARFIIQESVIAVSADMAQFAHERDIEVLYRNHSWPASLVPDNMDLQEAVARFKDIGNDSFAMTPEGFARLGLPAFMDIAFPLHRFADFVSLANLCDYFDGQSPSFPRQELQLIVNRFNRLERSVADRSVFREATRGPRHRQASFLAAKLTSGEITSGELATAIFNAVGNTEAVASLRIAATQFVAANIELARPLLQVAQARRLVEVRAARPEDNVGRARTVLAIGDVAYPYRAYGETLQMMLETVNVIARAVGTEVTPVVPERFTKEYKILKDADGYLKKLDRQGQVFYTTWTSRDTEGQFFVHADVSFPGGYLAYHTAAETGSSGRQEAATYLITQLDLANNTPPEMMKDVGTRLHNRLNKWRLSGKLPAEISRPPEGAPVTCALTVPNPLNPEQPFIITTQAHNAEQATYLAKLQALQLVPLPPRKT